MSKHKVAVYGSLKQGYGNHDVLMGVPLLTKGITLPHFTMLSLGGFPGLVFGDKSILVEIYEVDDNGLEHLDRLEGFPSFYNRVVVPVMTESNAIDHVWIYILAKPDHYKRSSIVTTQHPSGAITWPNPRYD